MGLDFSNPIGLAAGFDRCGMLLDGAARSGLGSVELGSLVAESPDFDRARSALRVFRSVRPRGNPLVVGVSLMPRPHSPWRQAPIEIASCLRGLRGLADYVTLNPGRAGSTPADCLERFGAIVEHAVRSAGPGPSLPQLVVKLPAAWSAGVEPVPIAAAFARLGARGLLIAAERSGAHDHAASLRRLRLAFGPSLCLISVGGIDTPGTAALRLAAGATLIQIHCAARGSRRIEWIDETLVRLARAKFGRPRKIGPRAGILHCQETEGRS